MEATLNNRRQNDIRRGLKDRSIRMGEALEVTLDVLCDLMQDDEVGPKVRLDAARASASLLCHLNSHGWAEVQDDDYTE